MARVKHKKVRQLLDEKRSKITDRQFFTSRILAGHFEDIAAAQTRRYKYNRRIHVYLYWDPKDQNVACTDNFTIRINCGHKVVTKHRGRQKRYIIVMALFAHELGHVLFTDFLAAQTYLRFLEHRKWFPDAPVLKETADNRRELALWDYAFDDPGNMVLVQRVAAFVENTIEDGYVEARVLNQFTGVLGSSLYELRECQLENMPTVEQMIEEEADGSRPTFSTILQILLSYAKYGQIKYGGTPLTDMRIQTVFRLITELDAAVSVTSARERWKVVSLIMIRCWDQIQGIWSIASRGGMRTQPPVAEARLSRSCRSCSRRSRVLPSLGRVIPHLSPARKPVATSVRRPLPVQLLQHRRLLQLRRIPENLRMVTKPLLRRPTAPPEVSRRQRQRRVDVSRSTRLIRYLSLLAVSLNTIPTTSGSRMTVPLRISTGCWNRWLKRPLVSSWRMNGSRS